MPDLNLTDDEISYAIGGLLDRYEETMRSLASTERMLVGEPCCDKTKGRYEAHRATYDALKQQRAILESAISKARAAAPKEQA